MIIAAVALLSIHAAAQNPASDARASIDAAVAAMGTAGLQSVQYSGTGSFYATG